MNRLFFFFVLFLTPAFSFGASDALPGDALSVWWALPFAGVLGSLAFGPIFFSRLWHAHYGKIVSVWSLISLAAMGFHFGLLITSMTVLETILHHYLPFIILIGALYGISGGIHIEMAFRSSALFNTLYLALGTLVASWIGTTGAAMLFIRPLIKVNAWRAYKRHLIIFFIFLVANIGGSLTPLGDPPLFLGFLNGVGFFWTTQHMLLPMIFCTLPLLFVFYLMDRRFLKKDDSQQEETEAFSFDKIQITGAFNLLYLLGVIGAVILSGSWKPGIFLPVFGVELALENVTRDILILLFLFLSLKKTSPEGRELNQYTWEPLREVAKIFMAIFITVAPVISILSAGLKGALAPIVSLVSREGEPVANMYFWVTGILSAFLDNAPTYLVFFHMAGGNPEILMGPLEATLLAISCGSVFMGALSYIGNAPNFMVKSIAEINNIQMPSFFGYMGWAFLFLLPLFLLVDLFFFF